MQVIDCLMCVVEGKEEKHERIVMAAGNTLCAEHLKEIYQQGKELDDFMRSVEKNG